MFPSRRAIPRPPRGRENSSKQTGLSGLPPLRAVRAGNAATGWKRTRLGACRALTGKKRGTQSASHLPVSPAVPGLMPLDHEHISFHSDGLAQGHGGGGGGPDPSTLLSGPQLCGHCSSIPEEPHRPARRRALTLDVGLDPRADREGGSGALAKHALTPVPGLSRLRYA